jgi:uncharacterized membrane protein YvlD (DUF360 family)
MEHLRHIFRLALRFLIVWGIDVVSLGAATFVLPGISLHAPPQLSQADVAVAAALVLGMANLVVRPLLLLLALPLGFYALLGVGFVANAFVLMLTAAILPGLVVAGWADALAGALLIALVNTVLTSVLTLDDDDSVFQNIVDRLAKRDQYRAETMDSVGLIMLEIDGLSYHHIKKAIAAGYMPTLKAMMHEEGYVLSRVDCGLPSQTSSCQAGILFGNNDDIPAFRWYDKDLQKLIVSSTNAPLLNERYAHGSGLLRGGSSINNMLDGDAAKSILTLGDLRSGDSDEQRRRANDIYLLMLNPYFFTRTLVLVCADVLRELWQGFKQRARNVQPRLNRLAKFYPLVRAATTVFMRDVAAYLVSLDIVRGTPALYTTWLGYDEVAHHSGPWTPDAFGTLRQYDRTIARIREVIHRKAPRPYDLIILSDHGQSFGATFKMRYGHDLKTFIEQHLPQGATINMLAGGDDGTLSVAAMAAELDNVQKQGMGGYMGRMMIRQADRALRQTTFTPLDPDHPTHVTAYGSGNLAQVYFDLQPRKLRLSELNAAYPGMVDALVKHDGIGFLVAYEDDFTPVCFGKLGARNLHTGQITGEDPLVPYGNPKLRAEQVRRVADFPHAGDLMVVSTVYPDGTVAALEELVGSHGGIGGEQTDAFIFHPPEMHVPETANSVEFFPILNARRGLPAAPKVEPLPERYADAWALPVARGALGNIQRWAGLATRAALLDHAAYNVIVRSPSLSVPALVISLASSTLASLVISHGFNAVDWLARILMPPLLALAVFIAGRQVGSRATFTRVLRTIGFAQSAQLLQLLVFVPVVGPLARLLTVLLLSVATWMGASAAAELRGWRSLVVPLVVALVLLFAVFILRGLAGDASLTAFGLAEELGLARSP